MLLRHQLPHPDNARDLNFNADLKVAGEREHHRDRFAARYYLSTEDGKSSENEFEATHDHDFLFPGSAWLIFVGGGYRFDDFQDWTHRLTSRTGVGYEFWNTETWLVSGRLGAGLTQEFDRNRTSPEGVVGFEAAWTISEGHRVTTSHFYFPSLNDLPAFRSVSRIEWKIPVGLFPGLAAKLGGSYEYDSAVRSPANNDRKYYGNVSYDF